MSDMPPHADPGDPIDAAESAIPHIHIVLPVVGALMMFLLATIAVTMA